MTSEHKHEGATEKWSPLEEYGDEIGRLFANEQPDPPELMNVTSIHDVERGRAMFAPGFCRHGMAVSCTKCLIIISGV